MFVVVVLNGAQPVEADKVNAGTIGLVMQIVCVAVSAPQILVFPLALIVIE